MCKCVVNFVFLCLVKNVLAFKKVKFAIAQICVGDNNWTS